MDPFPAVRPDVLVINDAARHCGELSSFTRSSETCCSPDLYPAPIQLISPLARIRTHIPRPADLLVRVVRPQSHQSPRQVTSTAFPSAGR
jgi:hypothetical protein